MSNSNGHITLPINIKADLGYVLGTGSGDLGYNIVNGNINKWARYKPVRMTGVDYSSQMNSGRTDWRSDATWWKGIDGHCGLSYGEYTALGSPFTGGTFFYYLKNGATGWGYNRPRGLANNEWFRAFDFFHYDANAPFPAGELGGTDIWLDNSYRGQFDWDTPAASPYALGLGDFAIGQQPIGGNFYLGILLWRSGGTYFYLTSSTKFVSGGSISIPFTASQNMVGAWQMVPFISSVQYSIGASEQAGLYASLFGLGNTEVVLHAPGTIVDFTVWAVWNAASTAIDYEVVVTNNDRSTSRTLTNVCVEIRTTTTESQAPASGDLVTYVNLGTITVGADSSITRTGSFNVTRNTSLIYWAKGYADGYNSAPYNQIEEYPE